MMSPLWTIRLLATAAAVGGTLALVLLISRFGFANPAAILTAVILVLAAMTIAIAVLLPRGLWGRRIASEIQNAYVAAPGIAASLFMVDIPRSGWMAGLVAMALFVAGVFIPTWIARAFASDQAWEEMRKELEKADWREPRLSASEGQNKPP